jgi:hypothetical protein
MTRKKALERWETKISNTEVTTQDIWPIAKSLIKRDGPRAPTVIHGASGLHPSEKFNAIADRSELLLLLLLLHNEELHNLYSSSNIVRMIKLRRMRWAGHVA